MKRTVMVLGLRIVLCTIAIASASGQSIVLHQTMGPYGGKVTAATVTPNGFLYIGSKGNGVFRSTDGGASWLRLGLVGVPIATIASDSNGTIYAGASNFRSIFRSSNLGATWEQVVFEQRSIGAITVDSGNTVIATAFGGVFRSEPDGSAWFWVQVAPGVDLKAATSTHKAIYVAGGQRVFKSVDRGISWTELTPLPDDIEGIQAISVDDSGRIYIGSAGVYMSTDDGKSWNRTPLAGRINALLTGRDGSQLAGANTYGMFRSTDGGETWTGVGLPAVSILALAQDHSGTTFAGSAEFGALRTDGAFDSTTIISDGLTCTTINAISIGPDGTLRAATNSGIFASSNGGYPWNPIGMEGINVTSVAVNHDGVVLVGSNDANTNGGAYRLEQSGKWRQIGLWSNAVGRIAVDAEGSFIATTGPFPFSGGAFGVEKSIDAGTSWTDITPSDWPLIAPISALMVGPEANLSILSYGFIRSSNNGQSWGFLTGPNQLANTLLFTSSKMILAGSVQDGIYRSPDFGATWQQIGLSGKTVWALAENARGWIFAGTQDGLNISTDGGETWSLLETEPNGMAVTAIAIDPNGVLYAAAADGNIYRSTGSTSSVPPTESQSISLSAAPNPARDRIDLRFVIPSAGFASAELIDATGSRCARVFDGFLPSGAHNISCDLSELPDGTYFLRIMAGNSSAVEPLIIAR